MERVRLDQHDLQIQLAEQLAQNGPLVVLACGIAGLADLRWTGFSGQAPSLTSEAGYRP